MATPFVQGRLQNRPLSVEIHTQCTHCEQPLDFTVDSNLRYQVHQSGAEPLIFQPNINWDTFTDPNIIHAY
jgi:hypothetical protein